MPAFTVKTRAGGAVSGNGGKRNRPGGLVCGRTASHPRPWTPRGPPRASEMKLRDQKVVVSLPKMHMDTRYLLTENLQRLGMKEAFDAELADFSGMTGKRDLYISKVIQQAFLDVSEAGTEAAAATAITMLANTVEKPKPLFPCRPSVPVPDPRPRNPDRAVHGPDVTR